MRRAIDPIKPVQLAACVFATTVPGRIYAEVPTYQWAAKLARSMIDLRAERIRPIPVEEYCRILHIKPKIKRFRWARVVDKTKKWYWYKGDTGLIHKVEGKGKLQLMLIPRLITMPSKDVRSRPPQALVDCLVLQAMVGEDAIEDHENNAFEYGGYCYSAEGLISVDIDQIDFIHLPGTIPTTSELDIFQSTSVLHPRLSEWTETLIQENNMQVGDRVKVIAGEYTGLIGQLMEINDDDVKVYIPCQDVVEDMVKHSVRASYRTGDQVKVVHGVHVDLVAWVVSVSSTNLKIVNVKKEIEVSNSCIFIE
jgi:ribosomal protein L24